MDRKPLYKGKDQTGKLFGKWKVLGFSYWDDKNYNHKWKCLCTSCGREFAVVGSNLILGKSKSCYDCSHLYKEDNPSWTGLGDIPGWFWYRIKSSANSRKIPVTFTIEDLDNLWKESTKKCSLSGIDIKIGVDASLDRIDSTKDYTLDNIQWVHKNINKMKNNLPEDEFIKFCKLVSNNKE